MRVCEISLERQSLYIKMPASNYAMLSAMLYAVNRLLGASLLVWVVADWEPVAPVCHGVVETFICLLAGLLLLRVGILLFGAGKRE